MFASPTSPNVKIIDFGLSKKYLQNETLSQTVGTVYTMAPEVIKGKYGELCDVWSIGVIAFMLLSSSLPFFGKSRLDVVKRIMDGRLSFKSRRWKDVSQQAKNFVTSLLVKDSNHRPSCSAALTHEWFKSQKVSRANSNFSASQVVSSAVMDRVQATIQTFAGYTKLKKLALYVIAHKSSADEIGFLQQLFRNRFDVEKDGVISLDEFKEALSVYSYTDDELEAMFHAIDIDGCDSLAYSEFLAATIEAHGSIEEGRIAEAFDRLDNDDTGYITVSNLADFLGNEVPEEFINEIIEEADVSKDHRIDYDEFLGLWDGNFDKVLAESLKDVREKRVVRCSTFFQALEEGEDGAFLEEEESKVASDGGPKGDSLELAPPGAGKYFFEQEKEKSLHGVWI
jgi:calcium-dependent protein kinase